MLREACRAAVEWDGEDTGDGQPPLVSVRLSARQARDPDLVRDVLHAIEYGGLPARRLQLRLGKDDLLGPAREDVLEALAVLADLGVGLAISDLELRPLPPDAFAGIPISAAEIAPDYLAELGTQSEELVRPVLAQVVEAARRHARTVIIGGVSTAAEVDLVAAAGADLAYGPYFG